MIDLRLPRRSFARRTLHVVISPFLASIALGGCGDGTEPIEEPEVVLEVQAPVSEQGAAIASIDYEIACDSDWRDLDSSGVFVPAIRRTGTLELTGPALTASGDEISDARLWSAVEAPLSGLCLLNLVGRDDTQRSVCAGTATFEAFENTSDRVDARMECLERPVFIGDLFVGAMTPEVVGQLELQTVEYTIVCEARGTAFFEGMSNSEGAVTLNGNLEVFQEPGRMNVEESFLELPVGLCTLQMRARNEDNEIGCAGFESFNIGPDRTTTVELVVDCFL